MKNSTKVTGYVKWLLETYAELRAEQAKNISHRVADCKKDEAGQYQITVQLIGKTLTFTTTPQAIMADDSLLESFSKKDIRLLTYLACEDIKEPTHAVVGQKFIRNMNQFFFKLKHKKTGHEIEKTAEEISKDPALIKSLHPEDAHKIGFVAAGEGLKKENTLKQ